MYPPRLRIRSIAIADSNLMDFPHPTPYNLENCTPPVRNTKTLGELRAFSGPKWTELVAETVCNGFRLRCITLIAMMYQAGLRIEDRPAQFIFVTDYGYVVVEVASLSFSSQ